MGTAIATLAQAIAAVGLLHGATGMLTLAGIGGISTAGAAVTWYLCRSLPTFSDTNSDHYVSDPVFIACIAAVISAVIAWAFMVVFDTVSDTILYCYAVNMKEDGAHEATRGIKEGQEVQPSNARSCFFGCGRRPPGAEQSDEEGGRIEHAPPELRRLLVDHH